MKTPYLNSLIDKLNTWKKHEDLNNEGEIGLSELIEIKRVLNLHVVSCCFDINKRKPKLKQEILYEGNHGFSVGVYDYFENGIGWVLLPEGGKDCFDRWKQK